MKRGVRILGVASVVVGIAVASSFAGETLTNDSIVDLNKFGLGEAVIVEKIKTSTCNFDTSTDALKKLKEAGISDTVIAAMIGASASKPSVESAGDPNDPNSPHDPGIWLYEESEGQREM